jgi:hypothetical protein
VARGGPSSWAKEILAEEILAKEILGRVQLFSNDLYQLKQ